MDHKIIGIRHLTESTFVVRFTRAGMQFRAGQHIIAGLHGELDMREYSVYSGEKDDYLEILVREVRDGKISKKLKLCIPGQELDVNGPFGTFGIEPYDLYSKKHVFIATGTGIAPFHSIVKSYPAIDYALLHGVRFSKEAYERTDYEPSRYNLSTSKEDIPGGHGRVTRVLEDFNIGKEMLFYLCGNGNMINEAYRILTGRGVPPREIFTERYF